MATWMKGVLLLLVSVGGLLVLAGWFGSRRWQTRSAEIVTELRGAGSGARSQVRGAGPDTTATVSFEELDGLPEPVARYFRRTLREGQPLVRGVRIRQVGGFRLREGEERWSPLEAEQHFTTKPRGFVWDARIRMSPLVYVRVRDGYVEARGSMQGRLLGLLTVVDEGDGPELRAGVLQRYLAEAVWFPTALLPSQGVAWTPLDGDRARATLSEGGVTVSLEFRFDREGRITEVYTPDRYRKVGEGYEPTPWAGRFRGYREIDGMQIPVDAEVEWRLPSGPFPYWRARLVEVEYDFGR